MILRAFLIYSSNFDVCTVNYEVAYVKLTRKKNVVLKMLLSRGAKAQQEIKMDKLKNCNYFQFRRDCIEPLFPYQNISLFSGTPHEDLR